MYFNLVMNAVDAMSARKAGVLSVSTAVEGECVALRVSDDGVGMTPEKVRQLLADRQTLDGEVHSLGFVFVRQTVAEYGGELAIESTPGKGTTITVRLPYLPGKVAAPPESSYEEKYRIPHKYRSFAADGDGQGAPSADATYADVAERGRKPEAAREVEPPAAGGERPYGKLIMDAYRRSEAQFPGVIFAIAVTEEDRVEMFAAKPYERDWNISHEDLSPMHFEATHRGRLEEDELRRPFLILKPPQNMREYFEFKEVPEADRGPEIFKRMVHDESVRIARTLIATGIDAQMPVHLASAPRFFGGPPELIRSEPFPLELLAHQKLPAEASD
jgi:hypothetical protein